VFGRRSVGQFSIAKLGCGPRRSRFAQRPAFPWAGLYCFRIFCWPRHSTALKAPNVATMRGGASGRGKKK
jgi:hypothetical protein